MTEGRGQSGEVLTKREREVLASLANTPRVDLRRLNEDEKQRIRDVLDELHNGRRLSLLRISQMVGKSYTKIWGLCRALEMHTRNVAEADRNSAELRSKHKRNPFDGTEEERAYMMGFKNGDLTALQVSGTAVMVTSSTTHPAFANLFHELFEKYGPVYQYPMQEKGKGYKWKVAVRLDNSFQFLLKTPMETIHWVASNERLFVNWLAGIVDSDGYIHISENHDYTRVRLVIYNTNERLLRTVKRILNEFGYHLDGPYRKSNKGKTTPYGITYRKDMWILAMQRTKEAQKLLKHLPLRHSEKLDRKALALSVESTDKSNDIKSKAHEIRQGIQADVIKFAEQAKHEYLSRHRHPQRNQASRSQ